MRILHLVHQYPPHYVGGTELYTRTLALAQAARGHTVDVFYRRPGAGSGLEERHEEGLRIWTAWHGTSDATRRFLASFGDARVERAFERTLDESAPDIVHVQHLFGLPGQLADAIRRRRIPFVVTLHDYWWICANANLITNDSGALCDGPRWYVNCGRCALARAGPAGLWPLAPGLAPLLAARQRMLQGVLRGAARVIAPSAFVGEWYAAHGVPAERIETLPHGTELPRRRPQSRPADSVLRVMYAGGLARQKGVHVLIAAFARLHGPAELWIAGDEGFDPAYSRELRAAADGRVRFLGLLDRPQLWQSLAEVDVVAVPTLWHETFSLITHEAQAAGLPVVASPRGALTSAVSDGVNGLLAAAGDVEAWRAALQRLLDEPNYLAELRERVEPPLSVDQHVARMESIYRSLLG